jgi:phthiocerol/phenolphthiocerol synthesis type-I polyketide synthase E
VTHESQATHENQAANEDQRVAVVGLSGRFPGAPDVATFWRNLCAGVESMSVFSEEELAAEGVEPDIYQHPNYVRAKAVLDGIDLFDAAFFEFNARDAELMDPQHRILLECAWESIEVAGYDTTRFPGRIGVYAGTSPATYLLSAIGKDPKLVQSLYFDELPMMLGNMADYLATRVSYKLGLGGPAMTVQSACSTSLVAVHLAAQAVLAGECEMALAGGVAVQVPHKVGYIYREGGAKSPEGHCRPFSREAAGTVGGSGAGMVLLKRYEDAVADGDHIWGVILGTAVNNDGSVKVGYTAPSVAGQSAVITEALSVAGISPETIGFVEAHGTGTPIGDPIEVTALTETWREWTEARGFCALGAVKSNIGHLDAAAGVTGFIKALLAVRSGTIPPTLNFTGPNANIDFASSPFFVNTEAIGWPVAEGPRRAAVSSFGIGGTNAHVVLEQPPEPVVSPESRRWQVLPVSGRSWQAVDDASERLAGLLRDGTEAALADVAYTLQNGRQGFACRRAVVARDRGEAVSALDSQGGVAATRPGCSRQVAFLFPGGGTQYVGMGRGLYDGEPEFRSEVDRCAELLQSSLGLDVRSVLYGSGEDAAESMRTTLVGLSSLFVTEYALARLLMSMGVEPAAMIGHSLGEYVAACLAGVFSLPDALELVVARARLFHEIPPGAMLSVTLPVAELRELVGTRFDIGAVNGPEQCVVSGSTPSIDRLAAELAGRGVQHRKINLYAAGHSRMLDPVIEKFDRFARGITLHKPELPYISNVTGHWAEPDEVTDPGYWVRHLRHTVEFDSGIRCLLAEDEPLLLEVGPGRTLSTLASLHEPAVAPITTVRHPDDEQDDGRVLATAVGRLWVDGAGVRWERAWSGQRRARVPLPTYPFQRRRYWLGGGGGDESIADPVERRIGGGTHARPDIETPYEVPDTDFERAVVGVWQELLGFEPVGVTDNFYALGGHSLLATRLVSHLRTVFEVELGLERVLAASTPRAQAQLMEELVMTKLAGMSDEEAARLAESTGEHG